LQNPNSALLSTQCLDRRIRDKQTLIERIATWQQERSANHTKVDWHFTTKDARIKLNIPVHLTESGD
jgi:hypothetical protein